MSQDNYGFTGSTDSIDPKRQNPFENNGSKYTAKDNSNNFSVVELEDKRKIAKELEGDYDPYKHREVQHPTTFWETLFHLMKGSLGTGILAMPKAFENAGYVVGTIGTIIIGLLCTYCIRVLIKSEYELCKRRKVPSMTYPGTMQASLEEGPKCLRRFSKYCPHICNTFLMVYQLGTCCVYTVFIAENLKKAMDNYVNPDIDLRFYMLALLLPLILINWVRNLKLLAPLSTIANFVTFASFAIILYYLFRDPIDFTGRQTIGDVANFPLFLGTVLFALEAIGVIMPLENEMKQPKKFMNPCGVLNIGMALNIILYVGIGFFGYIKYGDKVYGTITTNLPEDEVLSSVVQILLALAIFVTHSLQCYVAIDISWNEYIQPRMKHTSNLNQLIWEYVVRTCIVILTFILAVSIPLLELFISLFGALCLAMLGISFPALIQICAFWKVKSSKERVFLATRNIAVILFGLLGLVIGTYTSLEKIVIELGKMK
ncbi:proton-coupled amino acid transporter-like protein CG1139 [Nasonia vitripennis]|uniref:Amino acid transporter transmembrane domain-containing protein n=1 Tax=Nasonia vitripennis TaxID=7425 RepID=A0A7M7GB77_NASVI|nr:proton-coupled amino acid transporter-like protein CG1139 [Nasonia vitripennis]